MSRLVNPVKLSDLTKEGLVFEVDASNVRDPESISDDEDGDSEAPRKLSPYENEECAGIFQDEDTYEEGDPFEIIANKMFDLVPDGRIKKRILRKGCDDQPQDFDTVKIHYNAYLEFESEPFDSTYARNRPRKFTISHGDVIAGLDFGVKSMKLNEKSQFLIHPDYAFGRNCAFGRIPSNAQVLFEVELIDIIKSGASVIYEKLAEEQQKSFPQVYKYATALSETAKKLVIENDLKGAIKNYNMAVCRLEPVVLTGKEQIEKYKELMLKLYTNLLVCYTRSNEPRKGCNNAKKVYDLTQNGELMKIAAKVYFNHAKCLRILGEYETAKDVLNKAYKLEPKNPEIANEMLNLEKNKQERKKQETVLAKALIGNRDS